MNIRDIEISVDPHSAIWEQYMQDEAEYAEFDLHIPPQQPTHIETRTRCYTLGNHPRSEQYTIYTNRSFT